MADMPPRDFEALRAALVARSDRLSKRLSQVAQFFLNHPEEVAVSTLVHLADLAAVPPATITRFAKELGFQGFSDLQLVFRERLLGPRLPYAERVSGAGDSDLDQPGVVFGSFVQAAVQSLLRIEEALDRDQLGGLRRGAGGNGGRPCRRGAGGLRSWAPIRSMAWAASGRRAHLIDNIGAMRGMQVAAMGSGDTLLGDDFRRLHARDGGGGEARRRERA